MNFITTFCNYQTIISLTIFFMIFIYRITNKINLPVIILLNNFFNVAINTIIKYIVRRERPTYKLIKMTGYSFPSGHAMISIAMYGILIYLINKYIDNKIIKCILITINMLIILLVGISRVYLGVHYLSDVLAGYLISIVYLYIFINKIEKNKLIP